MKHYIYLEEHRVTYLCGRDRFFGIYGNPAALPIAAGSRKIRGAALDAVLKELAEEQGLSGKKVTLVLGQGLSFQGMVLPEGSRFAVCRMAVNQLTEKDGFPRDPAAAADVRHNRKKGRMYAALFYMEEGRLTEYKHAVTEAGMICSHVYAVPECMALAARELWKERSHLIVDVEEEHLAIYFVSGGHCLAFKHTSLKALHFCRLNGEALLYEEIAEQAECLMKLAAANEKEIGNVRPEAAVLLGSCLPSPEKGAASLEKFLKIPTFARTLGRGKPDLPSALAAASIAASRRRRGRPAEIKGRESAGEGRLLKGISQILSRGWIAFLLVNTAAALGAGIWVSVMEGQAAAELSELQRVLKDPEYRKQYQSALDMEKALKGLAAREAAYEAVKADTAGKNLLGMDAFLAFAYSMEPDMEVESLVFEGNNESLTVVISMSSSDQIPLCVERVKEMGVFPYVSHSLWEQREEKGSGERFYAVVRASLTEGGSDEAE